eukprot:scaffold73835_cov49-Phaeocystis_antarctica.AAC.3
MRFGARCGPGRGKGMRQPAAQVARFIGLGLGPTEGWGPQGTGGAHEEHLAHARGAGGVEA